MSTEERKPTADQIIHNHTLVSMGAGLVPIPFLDIASVTAVQANLLHQLANLSEVDYAENSSKAVIIALTGGTMARVGASALKFIPIVGSIVGGASMAAMSGASTYAVGQVFMKHFEAGRTLADFDAMQAAKPYEVALKNGLKKTFSSEKGETNTEKNEAILAQLEKLASLHKKKVINAKEFQKLKKKLMDS